MKTWMMAVAMVGMLATPAMAQTETNDKSPTQFIQIEGMEIDGGVMKAQMMRMKAKDRAKFRKVSRLKKSLLGKLKAEKASPHL